MFTGGMAVGSLHLYPVRSQLCWLMQASKKCLCDSVCVLAKSTQEAIGTVRSGFNKEREPPWLVGGSINRRSTACHPLSRSAPAFVIVLGDNGFHVPNYCTCNGYLLYFS